MMSEPDAVERLCVKPMAMATLDARQRSHHQHRHIRGVLLKDGTTVNCFRKNTHETHIIVLERAGHSYTYIHPNGAQTRHLSPTALSNHRAMVVETVEMRNRFAWQTRAASTLAPYVHRSLYQNGSGAQLVRRQKRRGTSSSSKGQPLRARWPTGAFNTEKLFDATTQRFEIRSIEGNARVCLHPSATLVDVYYVVQAKSSVDALGGDEGDGAADNGSAHAYYATIHQTFTLHHVPSCFAYSVQVLLHARSAAGDPNQLDFTLNPDEASGCFASSELPGNAAFSARPTFSALSTSHGSGDASGSEEGIALADVLRVATRPTRQFYERVAVEVKEDAAFYICRPGEDVLPSVIVQLAGQNAIVECTRGFFRWHGEDGQLQQQFTIETVPPATFFSTTDSSRTSVLSICQHAMDLLRSHGGSTSASVTLRNDISSEDDTEAQLTPQSPDVVEAVETEHGRFRAFADGKVRVVFQDRTILQVDARQELCSFFFADGTTGQTTVEAVPPAQRTYINRALEFVDWAFATPRERMLRYMRRQLNEEVAHQELQKIGIRFGMNHHDSAAYGSVTHDSKTTQQREQQHQLASGTDGTPHYLTLPMIKQLQEATQKHITSVNMLLHAPANASPPDPLDGKPNEK